MMASWCLVQPTHPGRLTLPCDVGRCFVDEAGVVSVCMWSLSCILVCVSCFLHSFEKRVYVPLPEAKARATMFKIHLGDTPNDLKDADFGTLGKLSEG